MLESLEVLYHASIRINGDIYFDPYEIKDNVNNAKLIFITHSHYDHLSLEDIKKVCNEKTKFIIPIDCKEKLEKFGIKPENIYVVQPGKKYSVDHISFSTIRAYNINKKFHPKENNWLGYIVNIGGYSYYIAGDTDENVDNLKVKCDVALVPIGGTYTMDYKEAANFINKINPKVAVPIHYNSIVGKKEDGENFAKLLNEDIICKLYL